MRLLYFAWLKERLGSAEEEIALPDGVRDVAGLIAFLQTRSPAYAAALAEPGKLRVAVNQDYAGPEHPVRAGDEVAIFPPVTGG